MTRTTLLSLALLLGATDAMADEPLWELGIGLGGLQFPHYRGSASTERLFVPLPYWVYRGDYFRSDRGGLRGLLLDTERAEVDISIDGAFPVNSDNNAREDMDDLAPVIEAGPSLNLILWKDSAAGRSLQLRIPARAAISVDTGPEIGHEGYTFAPNFFWQDDNAGFSGRWRRTASAGVMYADRRFHEYFYQVEDGDVRPGREAYKAVSGYSGAQFTFSSARRFEDYWAGLFARYEYLGGAVFTDSPLVERNNVLMVGFGISWVFGESTRRVPAGR